MSRWIASTPATQALTKIAASTNSPAIPLGALRTKHKRDPERDSGQRVTEIVDQIGEQRDTARHHEHRRLDDRRHPEHREREQHRTQPLPRPLDALIYQPVRVTAVRMTVIIVVVPVIVVMLVVDLIMRVGPVMRVRMLNATGVTVALAINRHVCERGGLRHPNQGSSHHRIDRTHEAREHESHPHWADWRSHDGRGRLPLRVSAFGTQPVTADSPATISAEPRGAAAS